METYRYAALEHTQWRVITCDADGAPTLPDPGAPEYKRWGVAAPLARSTTTVACALHAVVAAKEIVDAWDGAGYLRAMGTGLRRPAWRRAEMLTECWSACTPQLVAKPTAEILDGLADATHWDAESIAWAITRYSLDQDRLAFALQRHTRDHWRLLFERPGVEVTIELDDRGLWGLDGFETAVGLACGRGSMHEELLEIVNNAANGIDGVLALMLRARGLLGVRRV